jgi:hypothetical protein
MRADIGRRADVRQRLISAVLNMTVKSSLLVSTRRAFLGTSAILMAAPAIARAGSMTLLGAGHASSAVAPFVGIGDLAAISGTPAYAWWGLRAFNAAYAASQGPAVDLVDQAGANAITINVTTSGNLNVASVSAWMTAHSVTQANVTKVHDQTGNGRDLTQTTLSQMPSLILQHPVFGNQKPAIQFLRSASQQLVGSGSDPLNAATGTMSAVTMMNGEIDDASGVFSANGSGIGFDTGDNLFPFQGGFGALGPVTATAYNAHAVNCVFNGASSLYCVDGAFLGTGNSPGTTAFTAPLALGTAIGGRGFTGIVTEAGFWTATFTQAQCSAVNTNQVGWWFPQPGTAYEGLVALRCRHIENPDSTNKFIMMRSAHIATENLTSISVAMPVFAASAICTASVEFPAGTFTQLKFLGSVASSGQNFGPFFSDHATVSIPSGSVFWVRMFINASSATSSIAENPWQNTFLGEACQLSTTTISDLTMGGTITNSGAFSVPPAAIVGVTTNPSAMAMGDSICFGIGDTEDSSASVTGFNAKVGVIARSFGSTCFGNYGIPSATAPEGQYLRIMGKFTNVYSNYGINNLNAGGQSAATLIAALQLTQNFVRPFTRFFQTTTTPAATSTDGFVTVANQTPFANNAARVTFNDALRAGTTGIALTGFLEVANQLESSLDSGVWRVPGFNFDTEHPSTLGYETVEAANLIPTISWP